MTQRMLFECETLMMPLFARYDLTDASGYRLRLFFIDLFKWGDAPPGEIEDSRRRHVILLVAPSGTIAQYPWGLSSEN